MTTDDTALTERVQAAFLDEKPWRAAVEAVMREEGYTDEQIAEAYGPVVHTDECTDNGYPFGYDCTDEEGRDQHPLHTRSAELDNTYRLFFEESNLAAAVLPGIHAEVKRAQAQALRERADDLAETMRYRAGHMNASQREAHEGHIDMLRARADQIEKEQNDGR